MLSVGGQNLTERDGWKEHSRQRVQQDQRHGGVRVQCTFRFFQVAKLCQIISYRREAASTKAGKAGLPHPVKRGSEDTAVKEATLWSHQECGDHSTRCRAALINVPIVPMGHWM